MEIDAMSNPIKVDSHVHIYRTAEEGREDKEGYEVREYGASDYVQISNLSGTVADVLSSMQTAGVDKAIALNLYLAGWARAKFIRQLPAEFSERERGKTIANFDAQLPEALMDFNRWGCRVSIEHPEIVAFVCADVNVLSSEQSAAHIRDMVENEGARGVKLHGSVQGYFVDDKRLWPVYETCRELGLPVIGHSGPDTGGRGYAEPQAFAQTLRAFPELTVVLAHMGGGTWKQTLEIADEFPNAFFDCCEIIEWANSERGPTDQELAKLIADIGPHRVMMGSDFPWYDLDHTIERVLELPLLSEEEKHGILGTNAVRILRLE